MKCYEYYLESNEWKKLRQKAYERANHKCELCGALAEHIHHIEYPKYSYLDKLSNLIAVCDKCHKILHGIRPVLTDVNEIIVPPTTWKEAIQDSKDFVKHYDPSCKYFWLVVRQFHGRSFVTSNCFCMNGCLDLRSVFSLDGYRFVCCVNKAKSNLHPKHLIKHVVFDEVSK
jgi:hypothetical protein